MNERMALLVLILGLVCVTAYGVAPEVFDAVPGVNVCGRLEARCQAATATSFSAGAYCVHARLWLAQQMIEGRPVGGQECREFMNVMDRAETLRSFRQAVAESSWLQARHLIMTRAGALPD